MYHKQLILIRFVGSLNNIFKEDARILQQSQELTVLLEGGICGCDTDNLLYYCVLEQIFIAKLENKLDSSEF